MLQGRRGHARAVVLTVVDEELNAVLEEFSTASELRGHGCWTTGMVDDVHPVLVAQSSDRSNMPSAESVHDLVEDWRPEFVVLVGIAGGIVRLREDSESVSGPNAGDVVCVEYVHYGEYTKNVNGERQMRYFPVQHPSTELIKRHVRPLAREGWHHDLPTTRPSDTPQETPSDRAPGSGGSAPILRFGELVSVEFLAGDATVAQQRDVFGQYDHALAVDMESAGVARAMHVASSDVHYRPTWLCIRGISDRTAATLEAQAALGAENDTERVQWRPYASAAAARVARLVVERLLESARPPQDADPGAPSWSLAGA
ncbi:hypothetical protein [uncultured Cellulomonas sp.]|uniref:5'-methylthioadenosine/S-adenosylhomocysteine nucleosidase family protein n=1 Tax=uncultured Cellulomonas sp. TaxID=189682 RepID=UPI0028E750D4|nr:hypothetical protein [uncultured Cellulomonas sp.]